jgi:hypothetical protein
VQSSHWVPRQRDEQLAGLDSRLGGREVRRTGVCLSGAVLKLPHTRQTGWAGNLHNGGGMPQASPEMGMGVLETTGVQSIYLCCMLSGTHPSAASAGSRPESDRADQISPHEIQFFPCKSPMKMTDLFTFCASIAVLRPRSCGCAPPLMWGT